MGFRRYLVLILLVGFWLSFQGQLEPDFEGSHSSLAFHVADLPHQHEDSSRVPSTPSGDHKDQHGCYHSHAPFVAVTTIFECQALSTALVTRTLETPDSLALTSILHPPRA
jgi:ABC-type nickel/cobalt efflux system permease component RcnA